MNRVLSPRAKLRLRLAANFLRNGFPKPGLFNADIPRSEFYSAVEAILDKLDPADFDALKELVDWAETSGPS